MQRIPVRLSAAGVAVAAVILLASVTTAPPVGAQDEELTRTELAARERIAGEWIDLGRWAARASLSDQADECMARAVVAHSGHEDIQDLADDIAEIEGDPSDRDVERWDKRRRRTAEDVADLWMKLHALGLESRDDDFRYRAEDYLWTALDLDPSDDRWEAVLGIARDGVEGDDDERDRAVAIADRALGADPGPSEALRAAFGDVLNDAARGGLILRTAPGHPLRYWLGLPEDWSPDADTRYPILVCVDGAGSNFRGMGRNYVNRRGDLPYIVVSPCTFSNTNQIAGNKGQMTKYSQIYTEDVIERGDSERLAFDEAGLLAILDGLGRTHNAAERIYVTGFSGGGNVTYMMIFKHPDRVMVAAPACANFAGMSFASQINQDASKEDRTFPIHIITGAKDPHRKWTHGKVGNPGIEAQTIWAVDLLEKFEYPLFHRTVVGDMGHSPAAEHVIETFTPYMTGEKTRSDPIAE